MSWEQLAGSDGVIVGMAVDHRDTLRGAASAHGLDVDDEWLRAFKARAVARLARHATVVLIDHDLGRDALALVPQGVALGMPLEAQGHDEISGGRTNQLLGEFTPKHAAERGAVACKLLLHYRPDHEPSRVAQDALAALALRRCHDAGVMLMVEPIVYRFGSEDAATHARALPGLIARTAERIAAIGPDLLKLQFPSGSGNDAAACAELTRVCGPVPWVVLGGGQVGDAFIAEVDTARRAGAKGFIAGRTLWDMALVADEAEGEAALADVGAALLRRAATIARGY